MLINSFLFCPKIELIFHFGNIINHNLGIFLQILTIQILSLVLNLKNCDDSLFFSQVPFPFKVINILGLNLVLRSGSYMLELIMLIRQRS